MFLKNISAQSKRIFIMIMINMVFQDSYKLQ